MKALSWLGAFVLFVAIAAGTSSVLRLHSEGTHALAMAQLDGVSAPHSAARAAGTQVFVPTPSPIPIPVVATAKARVAAAPAPVRAAAPVKRPPAPPAPAIGSVQQRLINQDRAAHGLRPLAWSNCLKTIAMSNAVRMRNQGYISHTDGPTRDLGCGLGNHAGENVAWYSAGVNDTWANTAFMNSPDHRANILSPYYHYVATYWVTGANGGYIAVEFS